jgi:hypothetical protein
MMGAYLDAYCTLPHLADPSYDFQKNWEFITGCLLLRCFSYGTDTMSFYNGSIPVSDYWSGYVAQAQLISTPRLALLVLFNIPVLAIFLNVIWQLVRILMCQSHLTPGTSDSWHSYLLVTVLRLQLYSTGFLLLVQPSHTATTL